MRHKIINKELKLSSNLTLLKIIENVNLTYDERLIFYLTYMNFQQYMYDMFPKHAEKFNEWKLMSGDELSRDQLSELLCVTPSTITKYKNNMLDKILRVCPL